MKLSRLNVLAAIALLFLLASCSKTNTQGRMIPKDAAMVLHLNGKSLSEKLPWEEIKSNVLFQDVLNDSSAPAAIKQAIQNPDNSGIDIKSDLVVCWVKDSLGSYIAFEGTVKDAAKFKAFNMEASENATATETNGVSFIAKAPVCVGWNKDKFIYVIDAPQFNNPTNFSNTAGMTDMSASRRDNGATCRALFDLKENNSLAKDEKFSDLVKKEGDVHFFLNTEALLKGAPTNPMLSMIKLDKMYGGSFTTATANFNDGAIVVDYKSYAGKEIKDVLKKYAGGNLDENMLKRIPSNDVAFAFAFHFKPEGIKELLKVMEVEPLVNIGLGYAGFTLDDFIKANKGDIMMAVTDIKTKLDSVSYTGSDGKQQSFVNNKTEPDYIFSASVNDKDAFGKLIKAAQKFGGMAATDSGSAKISYNTGKDLFALSNSKETVDKYLAGTNNKADFISKLAGNPFGAYFNIQLLLRSFSTEVGKDSSDKVIYDASVKFWDNAFFKGGDYSDGGISYKLEINLLDKKTNSLKQLNQYLGVVAAIEADKKKKEEAEWKRYESTDTTTILAPVEKKRKKN